MGSSAAFDDGVGNAVALKKRALIVSYDSLIGDH